MLIGGMQDFELRVPRLIDHAEREHGTREVVTRWADGSETRTNWAGIASDARKLAQALERLGIKPGDRVATLAMNHAHHLVAWYGVIGMGGVVHTINPRLFDDQLEYIVNHAEDRVLLYDRMFQPIVDRLRDRWTTIERYVVMDGEGEGALRALLGSGPGVGLVAHRVPSSMRPGLSAQRRASAATACSVFEEADLAVGSRLGRKSRAAEGALHTPSTRIGLGRDVGRCSMVKAEKATAARELPTAISGG